LPGGSSGNGEEEGAREMGQVAGGVDRPVPPRLGDAGVNSPLLYFCIIVNLVREVVAETINIWAGLVLIGLQLYLDRRLSVTQ
jgi:hypothetical protein